jgi:Fic family protein
MASHHRLAWIHPFLDGNGRTARLALDGALTQIGLEGYGLWNISRGLAKNGKAYREHLRHADMPRQGDHDGRGPLSAKSLETFVTFMLDTALDQIEYMGRYLRLDELTYRMELFFEQVNAQMIDGVDPLPKYAELLLSKLLTRGECARGEVETIIGKSKRTATELTKELLNRGFIVPDTQKKRHIRLAFPSVMATRLFPDLVPEMG